MSAGGCGTGTTNTPSSRRLASSLASHTPGGSSLLISTTRIARRA
jgi:hypothetical protein